MIKKLFFPVLAILLFITSCNKDLNKVVGDPNAAVKNLSFTSTATTPIKFTVYISRPGNILIDNLTLYGVTTPYTYTSNKIQNGDGVTITVTGNNSDPIKSSLTIDGVAIPSGGSSLTTGKLYYEYWDTTVK